VRVLGRDAVGELVQVRLADDGVARGLERRDRRCSLCRDVLGEDRGAVGRPQPGRVEEVLDREPDALGRRLDLGDPDPGGAQ
jgi:hypothetical protein